MRQARTPGHGRQRHRARDRTLIEAIQDPLAHAIRNCIDHGLETPANRILAGKPPEGRLLLRAFHEEGQVTIEVSDDGAGIDVDAVRRTAVERGVLTPDQARARDDAAALQLIFLPGFSTASTVTNISGRGVGMDVVKTNIEQIGGRVSIHSVRGAGTTLRIRMPLTLAIMGALVVTSGAESYAVPQANVLELVRLVDGGAREIEMFWDAPVYRLRGELLPIVRLDAELADRRGAPRTEPRRTGGTIVVVQADDLRFGLVVDHVVDTQDIVVKPLGRIVRGIPIFSAATITGAGRVVLILDIAGIATRARVASTLTDTADRGADVAAGGAGIHKEALLLCASADGARMAVPLSQITRLEEFNRVSVEHLGGRYVMQYGGDLLPMAHLASVLTGHAGAMTVAGDIPGGPTLQTLVYSKEGRRLGVVVDRILDTVEEDVEQRRPGTRHGVAGSLVIDGCATEILDLEVLCAGLLLAPQGHTAGAS